MKKIKSESSAGETKISINAKGPDDKDVASELGSAYETWNLIIDNLTERYGEINAEWKASKGTFGWVCLLKHKKRTLLYLTPEKEKIVVGIVLGERAVALALASKLPRAVKKLISEARKYVEGRGIRLHVSSGAEVSIITDLVEMKTTLR